MKNFHENVSGILLYNDIMNIGFNLGLAFIIDQHLFDQWSAWQLSINMKLPWY